MLVPFGPMLSHDLSRSAIRAFLSAAMMQFVKASSESR